MIEWRIQIEPSLPPPSRMDLASIWFMGRCITIGGDLEYLDTILSNNKIQAPFNKYCTIEELYEDRIEGLLNHEYLHGVLFSIDYMAGFSFDNISEYVDCYDSCD